MESWRGASQDHAGEADVAGRLCLAHPCHGGRIAGRMGEGPCAGGSRRPCRSHRDDGRLPFAEERRPGSEEPPCARVRPVGRAGDPQCLAQPQRPHSGLFAVEHPSALRRRMGGCVRLHAAVGWQGGRCRRRGAGETSPRKDLDGRRNRALCGEPPSQRREES